MSIFYSEQTKTFTLHTDHTTYQMQVDAYGFLLHLYYGRRTEGVMDFLLTYADRGFSGNPYEAGADKTYSLDALPQEYPSQGTGDYRRPLLILRNSDGSYGCSLRYVDHEIRDGKYGLRGLPAVYADEKEAQTLEIHMEDPVTKVQVTLLYGVLPKFDIITRSAIIRNGGEDQIFLKRVQTACLDFVTGSFDFICFYGRHAMERNMQRMPVAHGHQGIGSRRGTSSHQYNPVMILAEKSTNEESGVCYGLSFVYSGGFKGEVGMDQFNQTRLTLGLSDDLLSYPLNKGEEFIAPEVVLTYSDNGLAQLSHNFHRCYRENLCRGAYKDRPRPVLLNSWEASYFNFTGESIYELAKEAADLGVEMLVMDDGWFGKRDDDNSGLGDWYVNEEKLGESLSSLVSRVNGLGLKFGIWFEPEAINEDSDLYRAHPDWALTVPGREPVRARNQLVLDFSRQEVVDYVFEKVCSILDQANIEYVKWDMNRSLADCYSRTTADQGQVLYNYVLGLYDFLERLITRYPNLLLEGCSGGGGRYDAGMLYYSPQIWCSDNTDAIDRIRIQYGTSFVYPACTVGAHVSTVPNHQTGRSTPLKTRTVTAMAGMFGYELDPKVLSEEEKEEVRQDIRDYKEIESIVRTGLYYRLTNPFASEVGAWEFVSEDGKDVLVGAVMLEIHGNMTANYVRLKGLKDGAMYRDVLSGKVYPANALMQVGIPLPIEMGEYHAYRIHFQQV
jgi:alpha-galactosidase